VLSARIIIIIITIIIIIIVRVVAVISLLERLETIEEVKTEPLQVLCVLLINMYIMCQSHAQDITIFLVNLAGKHHTTPPVLGVGEIGRLAMAESQEIGNQHVQMTTGFFLQGG
jgi:hypothetical protein